MFKLIMDQFDQQIAHKFLKVTQNAIFTVNNGDQKIYSKFQIFVLFINILQNL